jgi:diaminopimelate decarboxylase
MSIHSSPYASTFVYHFSSLPFALQVEEDGSIVKIGHEEKLDEYMKFFDGLPG